MLVKQVHSYLTRINGVILRY